jgi:hypothetical protein
MNEDTLEQLMTDVALLTEGRVTVSTDGTKSYVTTETRKLSPQQMGYETYAAELPNDDHDTAAEFLYAERKKLGAKYFDREDAARRGDVS